MSDASGSGLAGAGSEARGRATARAIRLDPDAVLVAGAAELASARAGVDRDRVVGEAIASLEAAMAGPGIPSSSRLLALVAARDWFRLVGGPAVDGSAGRADRPGPGFGAVATSTTATARGQPIGAIGRMGPLAPAVSAA